MLEGPVTGCTSPDFFGPAQVSQDCVDLYTIQTRTQLDMNQRVAQVYATGPFGTLPAGDVSWVIGGEFRAFEYTADPGVNAGPISGFGFGSPEQGTNEFLDGFFEVSVPLAETLDLSLGGRISRSQFEDLINAVSSPETISNSYKVALTWQATPNLLFRGSVQRAVRAPNFAELFAAGSTFPQIFNPCSTDSDLRLGNNGLDAVGSALLCTAIGIADPAFVEAPGPQMGLTFTGNTSLKPETADTYTIGASFDSPWTGPFTSLRGSIDYYSIKVSDAIVAPDVNIAIAECFNYFGTNPTFAIGHGYCAGLPGGSFANQSVSNPFDINGLFPGANEGRIQTSGIDIQLDATLDTDSMGAFRFGVVLSRLLEYSLHETQLGPTIDYVGSINYFGGGISLGQTFPDWRATLNAAWDIGDWEFSARGRYIDSMVNRMSLQYIGETSFTGVDSQWYWDLSSKYNLNDNWSFQLGVNNVADEPPQTYAPNVQSGTDPSTYDIIGRRVFATIRARY
jgi:outer membrane receptor protein involved in Fe transport